MCRGGSGVSREGILGGKKNVITYRWSELISIDIHWFCMTAARPTEGRQSKGVLLMADKGVYHLQKVGITTPREARVQVTHQQNTVGFLYGLLTSTKPGTCVPSLQAERAETLPAKWPLFPRHTECVWLNVHTCALRSVNTSESTYVWIYLLQQLPKS